MKDEIISFPMVAKPDDMPSKIWQSEYPDIAKMTDEELMEELSAIIYLRDQAI